MFYFLIKVYVQSRGFLLALLPNVSFISEILIIDWSITYCDRELILGDIQGNSLAGLVIHCIYILL